MKKNIIIVFLSIWCFVLSFFVYTNYSKLTNGFVLKNGSKTMSLNSKEISFEDIKNPKHHSIKINSDRGINLILRDTVADTLYYNTYFNLDYNAFSLSQNIRNRLLGVDYDKTSNINYLPGSINYMILDKENKTSYENNIFLHDSTGYIDDDAGSYFHFIIKKDNKTRTELINRILYKSDTIIFKNSKYKHNK